MLQMSPLFCRHWKLSLQAWKLHLKDRAAQSTPLKRRSVIQGFDLPTATHACYGIPSPIPCVLPLMARTTRHVIPKHVQYRHASRATLLKKNDANGLSAIYINAVKNSITRTLTARVRVVRNTRSSRRYCR
jgi:hypothetical protein